MENEENETVTDLESGTLKPKKCWHKKDRVFHKRFSVTHICGRDDGHSGPHLCLSCNSEFE